MCISQKQRGKKKKEIENQITNAFITDNKKEVSRGLLQKDFNFYLYAGGNFVNIAKKY